MVFFSLIIQLTSDEKAKERTVDDLVKLFFFSNQEHYSEQKLIVFQIKTSTTPETSTMINDESILSVLHCDDDDCILLSLSVGENEKRRVSK